jgi:hypothetical protein
MRSAVSCCVGFTGMKSLEMMARQSCAANEGSGQGERTGI